MVNKKIIDNAIIDGVRNMLHHQTSKNSYSYLFVGFSGGVDSLVLLHSIIKNRLVIGFDSIVAIHINHGISQHACSWEQFCVQYCSLNQIPIIVNRIQVKKIGGKSIENTARELRYNAFYTEIVNFINNDCCWKNNKKDNHIEYNIAATCVLGHHMDDQVETFFSQVLRGANIHNLASMGVYKNCDISIELNLNHHTQKSQLSNHHQVLHLCIFRPFLHSVSKKQIIEYARAHNIHSINDESNNENEYLRNFLRNKIIPLINQYNQDEKITQQKAFSSIEHLKEASNLINELAVVDFNHTKYIRDDDISNIKAQTKLKHNSCNQLLFKQDRICQLEHHNLHCDMHIILDKLLQLSLHRRLNLLYYYLNKYFSNFYSICITNSHQLVIDSKYTINEYMIEHARDCIQNSSCIEGNAEINSGLNNIKITRNQMIEFIRQIESASFDKLPILELDKYHKLIRYNNLIYIEKIVANLWQSYTIIVDEQYNYIYFDNNQHKFKFLIRLCNDINQEYTIEQTYMIKGEIINSTTTNGSDITCNHQNDISHHVFITCLGQLYDSHQACDQINSKNNNLINHETIDQTKNCNNTQCLSDEKSILLKKALIKKIKKYLAHIKVPMFNRLYYPVIIDRKQRSLIGVLILFI